MFGRESGLGLRGFSGQTLDASVVNRTRLSGGESEVRSRDTLAGITLLTIIYNFPFNSHFA